MTLDSTTGYYMIDVPEGYENAVAIFTEGKDATTNRYPADGEGGLALGGNSMLFSAGNSWKVYTAVDPTQPTTAPTDPSGTTVTILLGDVNEDGKVNLSDAVLVQKASIGVSTFTAKQKAEVDSDSNGKVNLADAIVIQKYALQISVSYPVGQTKKVVLS